MIQKVLNSQSIHCAFEHVIIGVVLWYSRKRKWLICWCRRCCGKLIGASKNKSFLMRLL